MDLISNYLAPFVFVGLGLFVLVSNLAKSLVDQGRFMPVEAIITKSRPLDTMVKKEAGARVMFGIHLEYRYEIGGHRFENHNIFKNAESYGSSDARWAKEFLSEYPVGRRITVFARRERPEESYILERAPRTAVLYALSVGAILFGIVLFIF